MLPNVQTSDATFIDQSPSNITDNPIDTSNGQRDAANNPVFGERFKHHRTTARRYNDLKTGNAAEKERLLKLKGETQFHHAQVVSSWEKTSTKAPKEATAEDEAILADIDVRLEDLSGIKYPPTEYFDNTVRHLRRFNNSKWKLLSTTYHVGDKRPSNEIRKECVAARKAAASKLDFEIKRPRHVDDACASASDDLRRHAERGKPSVAMATFGFKISARNGDYQLNTNPEIEFPQCMSLSSEFHTPVPMHNALDFMIWLHFDAVEKKILAEIKAKADPDAIHDKDRPAAIASAKKELLAAQHAEEAANVLCERDGLMVFRPGEWPVEVLLGLERDTSAPASPTKAKPTPVSEPINEEIDAPEFEDDTADA